MLISSPCLSPVLHPCSCSAAAAQLQLSVSCIHLFFFVCIFYHSCFCQDSHMKRSIMVSCLPSHSSQCTSTPALEKGYPTPQHTSIMTLYLNFFSLYLWFCPTSVRRNAVCGEVGGVDFVSPSPPLSSTPPSRRSATQPSSDQFHPNVTCPHVRLVSYMLMSIFVTTCNFSFCIVVLAPI